MNPFTEEATCDVCGGTGMGRSRDLADCWRGAKIAHSDPDICRENLEEKAEEIRAKKLSIQNKLNELKALPQEVGRFPEGFYELMAQLMDLTEEETENAQRL